MTYSATVELPFSLSKKTLSLNDFLKEVFVKMEINEDAELISLMTESEDDEVLFTEDFLAFVDKQFNTN